MTAANRRQSHDDDDEEEEEGLFVIHYNSHNLNVNNHISNYHHSYITVINSNQIGKNGITEAELIAGSSTGK